MNDLVHDCLETNIDLALANGFKMNRYFSLVEKDGYYMALERSCHPLETMVLGQKIRNPINVDIARYLGVHPSWVDGFLDGYGGSGYDVSYHTLHRNDPLRRRYTEGFEDGHEVESWIADMDW